MRLPLALPIGLGDVCVRACCPLASSSELWVGNGSGTVIVRKFQHKLKVSSSYEEFQFGGFDMHVKTNACVSYSKGADAWFASRVGAGGRTAATASAV